MSSTTSAVRSLVVWTHGATNSAKSESAIAVHYESEPYEDYDRSEVVPAGSEPKSATYAAYWAIARAMAGPPSMTHLRIKTEDELAVCTLNFLLQRSEVREHYTRSTLDHTYSQHDLVDRIMDDVKARKQAGCNTIFEFVDAGAKATSQVSISKINEARQMVQQALSHGAAKDGTVSPNRLSSASMSTIGSS